MNREEKSTQTRQKILDAAIKEFSEKNYSEASLNTICTIGNLSKGIIYHYFKDKDELYLVCMKECFDALTSYLSDRITTDSSDIKEDLQRYFDLRSVFFSENPRYLKLFCSATIFPPLHLILKIAEIRKSFDCLNINILTTLLSKVSLRADITVEEVIEEFRMVQDFVNTRYQLQEINNREFSLEEHEKRCNRSLNILLYGIIERGEISCE